MLKFEEITKKLIELINADINSLQNDGIIKQDTAEDSAFKFRIYDNDGEYFGNQKAEFLAMPGYEPVIIGCIRPGGGAQDTSTELDIYNQIINLEFCANISQFKDLKAIFDLFSLENKAKIIEIDGTTCKLEISELPIYGEKYKGPILENSYEELEVFNINLSLLLTEYEGIISNDFKLVINGEEIKTSGMVWQRTTDKEVDTSEIRAEIKTLSTSTNLYITFDAFLTNGTIINNIFTDILTNNYFGQLWDIELNRNGTNILGSTKKMQIKEGRIMFQFGGIVKMSVSLVPGIIIT